MSELPLAIALAKLKTVEYSSEGLFAKFCTCKNFPLYGIWLPLVVKKGGLHHVYHVVIKVGDLKHSCWPFQFNPLSPKLKFNYFTIYTACLLWALFQALGSQRERVEDINLLCDEWLWICFTPEVATWSRDPTCKRESQLIITIEHVFSLALHA